MYNVSTEFKNKIKQNSRRIVGKLLLGNLELTPEDISNMNMEYSLGNDGIPAVGGVVASKLEVKLFRDKLPPVLTTQELKPYLGIEVSPGAIEYVPMGVFRISPKDTIKTDKTITLVGYDILFLLENSPYNSKLKFPNTLNNIKAELETKGLKFAFQTLTNVIIKEKPNTVRELLSDVSELLGMNVVVNKLGEIEFRKLTTVEFDLYAENYYNFKLLADDDVKLTRLTVEKEGEENEDLTYGDDTGYTIKIKNDSITTQNELITVYNRVFPLSYTAYECNMQGMPHIDVGDTINLTDRHGIKRNIPIVYHRISYSGGLRSEIRANAPSGAISSTGSTGSNSITQSLNDLRVNILEVNTVLADKVSTNELDANVARIEKIINTNLEAINAKIDDLDVEDLTAINAHITALKGNVAEIDTILSKEIFTELASVGQIVAGSGIIADGAIGDAQINAVTAGKIKSGTLDTSLVTVAGTDGKLNITGNRLQVIHEGLERVALGDVNRDGTVYGLRVRGADGETVLFDERGLTREGLTDGAIDDSKVDDAANIQGHKLDINSVIREINIGDEVIKGTRVQVGDRSLNVELSTMRSSIGDNSQDISNQRTQIQALDDAIKFKVDNQTFNQYKTITDENITTINTQLSKNTSAINLLQDEIELKVTQTDIDKSISELVYDNRNLLKDSKRERTNEEGSSFAEYVSVGVYDIFSSLVGEEVTISFEIKSLTGGTIDVYTLGRHAIKWHTFQTTTEYQSFSFTTVVTDKGTDDTWTNLSFYGTYGTGRIPAVRKIKIEKGNKATDWTPAPEDIENEITSINTKVADININLDSITERVSSTESKIIKVNDEVSAIESRVSIAEQKITDDSIINTVRSSTAYINDLNNKANQEDLKVAESIIEQHTDEIAKRVTIDGLGSEIIQNADAVRVAVGKIGATNLIQYSNIGSRGKMIKDKYIYDGTVIIEPINLHEGLSIKIPQVKPNTDYILSFKYKKLSGSLVAFGGGTNSTYENNIATVDGKGNKPLSHTDSIFVADDNKTHEVAVKFKTGATVSPDDLIYIQPNRGKSGINVKVEITELQFEEGEYVTAWKPYPGEGEGPGYLLTGDAATFKNTSLKIINENNYPVFEGTTDGMLKIMAQITTGYQIGYNLSIIGSSITFEYAKANEGRHQVGAIAAGLNPFGANSELEEGISITHNYGRHIALGGWSNKGEPHHYLILDRENRLGFLPQFPAIFLSNVGFYYKTRHFGTVEIMNNIYFKTGNRSEPNIDGHEAWLNLNSYEISINGPHGTDPRFQYQASSGKSVFFTNMHVNKDFTVSGKKNALHKTKNYGDRLINSYEMAEYYSGDLGSGKLGKDGLCYIYIDDIFDETINTNVNYHVIYGKYGRGDIYTKEKHFNYFVVKGEPNLKFSWELKAKRDGYEYDRLEVVFDVGKEDEISIDYLTEDEKEERSQEELKEILNNEMNFDLSNYVLGGEEFENIN